MHCAYITTFRSANILIFKVNVKNTLTLFIGSVTSNFFVKMDGGIRESFECVCKHHGFNDGAV